MRKDETSFSNRSSFRASEKMCNIQQDGRGQKVIEIAQAEGGSSGQPNGAVMQKRKRCKQGRVAAIETGSI